MSFSLTVRDFRYAVCNMESGIKVRRAAVEDAEQIVAILNPIIAEGLFTVFDAPISVEAEREYIARLTDRSVFLVAEATPGQIVGFQSLEPFHAPYTHAFDHVAVVGTYVAEGHRRRGVSRALFPQTFEAARRVGYQKIFSFVRSDNPAALAAYQAHGFRLIGTAERQARIRGRYIDEVLIEKQLESIP